LAIPAGFEPATHGVEIRHSAAGFGRNCKTLAGPPSPVREFLRDLASSAALAAAMLRAWPTGAIAGQAVGMIEAGDDVLQGYFGPDLIVSREGSKAVDDIYRAMATIARQSKYRESR
jgi:hypothetical protein